MKGKSCSSGSKSGASKTSKAGANVMQPAGKKIDVSYKKSNGVTGIKRGR